MIAKTVEWEKGERGNGHEREMGLEIKGQSKIEREKTRKRENKREREREYDGEGEGDGKGNEARQRGGKGEEEVQLGLASLLRDFPYLCRCISPLSTSCKIRILSPMVRVSSPLYSKLWKLPLAE